MVSERKSSCTDAASSRWLTSSPSVASFWMKSHLKPPWICAEFTWICKGSRRGLMKCFFLIFFFIWLPFSYSSSHSPVQSYWLKCHFRVTDTCRILTSWLVILEILIPGNTINQTVTQLLRLTLRVPPQLCDLWSIPLISNNFLQRTDTSVICHKCWDISEGKRLFFGAERFFWSLLRLHWHDIQRTVE